MQPAFFSVPWRAFVPGLVCVLALAARVRGEDFALRSGDRVVFYGDSITDQRLYTTFTETYVVTRFPKLDVQFVHSGWGGDRVSGGGGGPIERRLTRDVFAYRPTVMTIMLGMNDGSYRAFDPAIFETYSKGYERLVSAVKKEVPGVRITLIQPSPFDDVTQPPNFEGGYNAVLVRYGRFLAELADREKLGLADLNGPVVAALEKAKAANAELSKKIIPDRVHPGASGHLLMAGCLLRAWHAPATVSSVELDAAAKSVATAVGTRVTDLATDAGLSWTQLDEALPMPLDLGEPVMALALRSSDFVDTLNRQPLKVTGLGAAQYRLEIDGVSVGTFSKEDLAQGLNLAILGTPMTKQAAEVHRLTLEHNNLHFTRWRQIQVPLANNTSPRVQKAVADLMQALDDDEAALIKQQRAAAQPVARKYRLLPI